MTIDVEEDYPGLVAPAPAFPGAVCAQTDPELFFPEFGHSPRPAKRLCAACPSLAPCREWGLENPRLAHGVIGGLTARERGQIRAENNDKAGE